MKTKEEVKHTPTPWYQVNGAIFDRSYTGEPIRKSVAVCGGQEATEKDCANAAFIVRAVNSHEALLEAAREAQVALHAFLKNANMLKLPDDSPLGVVWKKLEKAIAQAEGK